MCFVILFSVLTLRARPFGSVPWWRLDLLRRLWPLHTWARLRFLTNCYLLIMLLLALPVSFSLNLGYLAAGLVVMIGGLPFFLCLMTLPRHWTEVAQLSRVAAVLDGLSENKTFELSCKMIS